MNYEIYPTKNIEQSDATVCHESEADQWSLYERHESLGFSQAVWIADFARQEDALAFMEILKAEA